MCVISWENCELPCHAYVITYTIGYGPYIFLRSTISSGCFPTTPSRGHIGSTLDMKLKPEQIASILVIYNGKDVFPWPPLGEYHSFWITDILIRTMSNGRNCSSTFISNVVWTSRRVSPWTMTFLLWPGTTSAFSYTGHISLAKLIHNRSILTLFSSLL